MPKTKISLNSILMLYSKIRVLQGLKNAGSTFIHTTAKVLGDQIGWNVLTYADDIIVLSSKRENHIADLSETFANFRTIGLKLNPAKSIFGVERGKFLGCFVSTKGIEANPSKIDAILNMKPPNSRKAVQRLTCRLASLNRFVSKLAERSLPFFEVLKGTNPFQWGEKQQEAFKELKKYLIHLTTLSPPDKGTNLLLYASVAPSAVSAVLVQERSKDGKKEQIPVYFVS